MLDALLVPEKTVVTAKGDSESVDLSPAANPVFLATLTISQIVEQESIEVSFFSSADGTVWPEKPVAALPQKFYPGEYPLLIDLAEAKDARYLRAHWDVNRWGRGPASPTFEICVRVREIPAAMLQEADAEARSRR